MFSRAFYMFFDLSPFRRFVYRFVTRFDNEKKKHSLVDGCAKKKMQLYKTMRLFNIKTSGIDAKELFIEK